MKRHTFLFKTVMTITFLLIFVDLAASYPLKGDVFTKFFQKVHAMFFDVRRVPVKTDLNENNAKKKPPYVKGYQPCIIDTTYGKDPETPPAPPPRPR